jgi:hypothetical protein
MHCSDELKSILPVCCFCDKVRDDTRSEATQGLWQDLQIYMVLRKLRPEDIVFAYTCCRDCLKDDPRAIAFRTRWGQSSSSAVNDGDHLDNRSSRLSAIADKSWLHRQRSNQPVSEDREK